MIMAGGTGGHVFPGLAVADALRAQNWRVVWLGAKAGMEAGLVAARGYEMAALDFSGLRGNALKTSAYSSSKFNSSRSSLLIWISLIKSLKPFLTTLNLYFPSTAEPEKIRPGAFLSYVRLDDEHEAGRITELGKLLAGEVRFQTGQPFHIFQDRDIRWGEAWRARIEQAVDTATFFLPVITPSFFRSAPCRTELTRFLEREKRLGRTDLILPLYYVRLCSCAGAPGACAHAREDPLKVAVFAHQFADWRKLRHATRKPDRKRKHIDELALQLVAALQTVR